MAKKKASNSKHLGLASIIATALGVLSVILFGVLPMMKSTLTTYLSETNYLYSGFSMIFGGEATNNWTTVYNSGTTTTGSSLVEVSFNTMAFVAFLLVVLGTLVSLANLVSKSLAKNKLVGLLAALLLLAGGVMMVTVKGSCLTALNINEHLVDLYSLGYGAIVSGIVAMLAGLTTAAVSVLKK